jgi:hypothetical protein
MGGRDRGMGAGLPRCQKDNSLLPELRVAGSVFFPEPLWENNAPTAENFVFQPERLEVGAGGTPPAVAPSSKVSEPAATVGFLASVVTGDAGALLRLSVLPARDLSRNGFFRGSNFGSARGSVT